MDAERIERYYLKLSHLEKYYHWLVEWMTQKSLQKIEEKGEFISLMGIYHTAQNATALIIDICAMINKDFLNIVQDNYTNLEYLLNKNIIDIQIRNGIQNLIGLRNRLAHDYNGIIDKIAWDAIKHHLTTMEAFHKVISTWINQQTKNLKS